MKADPNGAGNGFGPGNYELKVLHFSEVIDDITNMLINYLALS